MRTIALFLLSCLTLSAQVGLRSVGFVAGVMKPTESVACDTLQTTLGGTSNNVYTFAYTAGRTFIATSNYIATGYTCCRVDVYLLRVDGGGAAPDLVCEIRANNDTSPTNSALATSTTTIHSADVGTDTTNWVRFNFSGFAFSDATIYWVTVKALSTSGADYYKWVVGPSGTSVIWASSAGSAWSAAAERWAHARLYSQ